MAAISPATTIVAATAVVGSPQRRRTRSVRFINGLNSFGGLKAHNNNDSVLSLGLPISTEQCFANVVCSLKQGLSSSRGGALTSTCSAVSEIFTIAAIMNGLTLVGVAVGFVLLRIEAIVEEE